MATERFPISSTHPLIQDPHVNRTFDDILAMDDATFTEYIRDMRAAFLRCWDEEGFAPTNGWSRERIDADFAQLSGYDLSGFWRTDELTGKRVIWNTSTGQVGSAVNGWNIAQMYKTRINYNLHDIGRSIYDYFSKPELFERYLPYARRHFLRDSFFSFALTVLKGDALPHRPELRPATALDYLRAFAVEERPYHKHEVLLLARSREKEYVSTGFNEHTRERRPFVLSYTDLTTALAEGLLPPITLRNVATEQQTDAYEYHIRLYQKGQRLFPELFRSFRISMCQYAVNFPPLTARLLYETFLSHVPATNVRVWDPSAGWSGRLVGALSYNRTTPTGEFQHLEYVGTDPNPVFYKDGTSVYHTIRDHYNDIRGSASLFGETHDAQVLQLGSELFHTTDIYAKWKGRTDLVFTSPPYFNREAYSDDPNQSYKKFNSYDLWRDEFLQRTLQTAWELLAPQRYLLWNIADLKIGKSFLPLEQDSVRIATALGFEYKETILMALNRMPGANRLSEDGDAATAKNSCKVDGKLLKYEPVHVFWKP